MAGTQFAKAEGRGDRGPTDSEELGGDRLDRCGQRTVAFGAASVLGEDFRVAPDSVSGMGHRGIRSRARLAGTREDNEFPVEVLRGDDRTIEVARMCFVTDVDELEGLGARSVGSSS